MTTTPLPRPAAGEYGEFYAGYISEVPDGDLMKFFEQQLREVRGVLSSIAEGRGGFRYAEGKWSIKEVIGHMNDAERIFAYRALRFARNDASPLASFDENAYATAGEFDRRTMASLVDEFVQVRDATLALFRTFTAESGARIGTASGKQMSARALGWVIAGHTAHHVKVLKERYGVGK
jgi:uncharacterized damage-inducible protein DinB